MPVLSEYDGGVSSCGQSLGGRFLLGVFGLVVCALLLLQHRRRKALMSSWTTIEMGNEEYGKQEEDEYKNKKEDKRLFQYDELTRASPLEDRTQSQQQREQEQQQMESANLTNMKNLSSIPASTTYEYPPSPTTYTSTITSSTSTSTKGLKLEMPRRRSYTKTITTSPDGALEIGEIVQVNVSGEIMISPDGWRRHTRVFGGGPCRACEESDKNRAMMGASP